MMAFHLNGVIVYKYFINQKLAFPQVPRRSKNQNGLNKKCEKKGALLGQQYANTN